MRCEHWGQQRYDKHLAIGMIARLMPLCSSLSAQHAQFGNGKSVETEQNWTDPPGKASVLFCYQAKSSS